ncbi:hypothetical protein ACO0LG_04160 [Undibacterium sp. Ji42W]
MSGKLHEHWVLKNTNYSYNYQHKTTDAKLASQAYRPTCQIAH